MATLTEKDVIGDLTQDYQILNSQKPVRCGFSPGDIVRYIDKHRYWHHGDIEIYMFERRHDGYRQWISLAQVARCLRAQDQRFVYG